MTPNSDGYVRPSFSRLPPPLGDLAKAQLYCAYRRERSFQDVPRSAYDLALSAMPPIKGLTSEEFRQFCWEGLNGLVGEPSSEAWRYRKECFAYADRKMAFYLAANPMLGGTFRLTRRLAESAVGALVEAGDLPAGSFVKFESTSVFILVETLAAGVRLRLTLAMNYEYRPAIDSRLNFVTTDIPIAFADPGRVFFERLTPVPQSREDFAPLLGNIVRRGRLLQTTIAAAFSQ